MCFVWHRYCAVILLHMSCDLKIVLLTLSAQVSVCKFQVGRLVGTEYKLPRS
jgi:hypothetical protein